MPSANGQEAAKSGACPIRTCAVSADDLVYRHEQKIVDTMLACDMIFAPGLDYEQPRAVLDSSAVVSGIGWRGGEARAVLKLLAAGGFESWRTPWITAEWTNTVQRVAETEKRWRNSNWTNWTNWLEWLKAENSRPS